ncbi:nuclear transport factor 2 family protein [Qipengyuania sp. SS22]|uniref:nuclear transport factor 2 family protein n=1 Tax=Qipengyuania sp. SS22 TaxID=2979461 RepID=UPI0021E5F8AB|nr:nuclear transport factor 2 family protein [Qipengyuania sp. SS22]UYH53867.1 nuclear transport factor 2 family protein [Qipengyuania sp. SS22]
MLHFLFKKRLNRKARANAVCDVIAGLNSLDYEAVSRVLAPDAVLVDGNGLKLQGLPAIIDADRAFREQADRPQIQVDTLDHSGDEVLVRGHIDSSMPEIDGPVMWRIYFDGAQITRVEITRPPDRMTGPLFAAQRQGRRAS